MPSLLDIRRRIRSVKNTRQITKALKMISAAKLRRAQDRVIAARPYAESMQRMLANVAKAVAERNDDELHPLLARRPEEKIQILLVTADAGRAGAFNANLIRATQKFITDHSKSKIKMELIGRKGRDFFIRRHPDISGEHIGLFQKTPRLEDARDIAQKVIERFEKAEIDSVYLVVNHFKSAMAPLIVFERILPIEPPDNAENINYIFEQDPADMLATLLPRFIEGQIFRSLLESSAAEHAARMTAMDAASTKAGEVIDKLTLNMNRVRQASITREIIEIVSGASALG
jgi:F-type H+-transporting ATPase subunit gamma